MCMRDFTLVVLIFTFAFYTLNLTGFSIKRFVLAESCIKDEPIDIVFWLAFGIALVLFIVTPGIGKFVIFGLMLTGFCIQYYFTFRFFFKPNENKIAGYNKCFEKTHHIIPPSSKKLIPDTFHLSLFALLIINLATTFICLFI